MEIMTAQTGMVGKIFLRGKVMFCGFRNYANVRRISGRESQLNAYLFLNCSLNAQ